MTTPSARVCEICGKTKSVTWHRAEVDGKTRLVCAHLRCFLKWRKEHTK